MPLKDPHDHGHDHEEMSIFRKLNPMDITEDISNLRGDDYRLIFRKVYRIVRHQFANNVHHGIRGFVFWGDVGVGKTVMVKALARELGVPLLFVDGSDIARPRYGESEQLISELFSSHAGGQRIILIDDAESVFPRRDWVKGEAWHIAQNNVLFHELDQLDTANVSVILTTNQFELMDKALISRLLELPFPLPARETMVQVAKDRCDELMVPWQPVASVLELSDQHKNIRDVEKLVLEYYVEQAIEGD